MTQFDNLEQELKDLISDICDIDSDEMKELQSNEALIGSQSRLQLDSLDSLEITVAVQKKYGVHIDDKNTAREVLQSLNALSDFVRQNRI